MNNVGQFRAVRDISVYPVDFTDQAEQEDNDDTTDERRGSLEHQGSLDRQGSFERWGSLESRSRKRKLSNDLEEVYIQ